MTNTKICKKIYPNCGPGDRIVECGRAAGHAGNHWEVIDGEAGAPWTEPERRCGMSHPDIPGDICGLEHGHELPHSAVNGRVVASWFYEPGDPQPDVVAVHRFAVTPAQDAAKIRKQRRKIRKLRSQRRQLRLEADNTSRIEADAAALARELDAARALAGHAETTNARLRQEAHDLAKIHQTVISERDQARADRDHHLERILAVATERDKLRQRVAHVTASADVMRSQRDEARALIHEHARAKTELDDMLPEQARRHGDDFRESLAWLIADWKTSARDLDHAEMEAQCHGDGPDAAIGDPIQGAPIQERTDDLSGPADEWAIVELLGHRRLAGRISDVQRAGVGMLRLDIPADGDDPERTQLINPTSIYCLHPCGEATARAAAAQWRPEPVARWELPGITIGQPIPDIDDDEDDEAEDEHDARG